MPIGRDTVYHGVHIKIDFELNRSGIREIANGPEIVRVLESIIANLGKPVAEGLSAEFIHSGDYERSFRVENTHTVAGPPEWPMRRASCRLVNISDHAVIVEVGTKNSPAHHIMRKTLEHLVAIGAVSRRHRI